MDSSDVLLILVLFAAVFVFKGDPNLWDKWHEQAMKPVASECAK